MSSPYTLPPSLPQLPQELISHHWRVCRLPREVVAGLVAEQAAATAAAAIATTITDTTDGPTTTTHNNNHNKAKKRRSASIHSTARCLICYEFLLFYYIIYFKY